MNRSGVPEPRIEYAPKHYLCKRAGQPLVLDGRVDKAFWDAAEWTDDFVDIEGAWVLGVVVASMGFCLL